MDGTRGRMCRRDLPGRLEPKLPPPFPIWARVATSPLVLVLPILCLFTLVLRVAIGLLAGRAFAPRLHAGLPGLLLPFPISMMVKPGMECASLAIAAWTKTHPETTKHGYRRAQG